MYPTLRSLSQRSLFRSAKMLSILTSENARRLNAGDFRIVKRALEAQYVLRCSEIEQAEVE
jgi:hypothetical protein